MADVTKINLKGTVLTVKDADAYHTGDLATVATSGSYDDLTDKPTIPAAQVQPDWNASSGMGAILNKPSLATVATSGSYNDLSNKPTIPDVSGFATTAAMNTALAGKQDTLTFDTTPTANSTKPVTSGGIKTYVDGKATITGITTSQDGTFTISLSDGNSYTVNLNHVHPQYLDVDDIDEYITAGTNVTISKDSTTGVLTISVSGGTQVQANWNESDTSSAAYIQNKPTIPTVPTNVSSFTNDAGYLTSHQSLSGYVQSSASTGVTTIVVCDETTYNGLNSPDSNTLYLIPESNA